MDPSRISIRPFKLSDVDDYLKWVSDDRVAKNVRWGAITSREEALLHLERAVIPHPWHLSICLDDRSIGYIAVWQGTLDYEKCRAHIGYAIGVEHWGQGIATVALKMAMSRVFKDLPNLVRLEAYTLVDNKKSQRVLEKVGFLKEGLLRKVFHYQGEVRDFLVCSFLSTDKIL
ncbi:uncharacterized N-acetyltransferase p20 [Ricinus communis]|uniref:uncharacterized N-acetyltransferase p20 n=1 Tax=Ricinus communis TaxID=3988 RepID=UPI0007722851|nr:uncharacterized N-acetyltransferase p20 [Ricinus communis]|eukprot:XP_015573470.1 uncharacterized protein LOC8280897 [Ricinus communis]